jgi:hypothetical protein
MHGPMNVKFSLVLVMSIAIRNLLVIIEQLYYIGKFIFLLLENVSPGHPNCPRGCLDHVTNFAAAAKKWGVAPHPFARLHFRAPLYHKVAKLMIKIKQGADCSLHQN